MEALWSIFKCRCVSANFMLNFSIYFIILLFNGHNLLNQLRWNSDYFFFPTCSRNFFRFVKSVSNNTFLDLEWFSQLSDSFCAEFICCQKYIENVPSKQWPKLPFISSFSANPVNYLNSNYIPSFLIPITKLPTFLLSTRSQVIGNLLTRSGRKQHESIINSLKGRKETPNQSIISELELN